MKVTDPVAQSPAPVFCFCYQEADMDPSGEAAQKTQQLLTYYELDLGLNHVVRKYSEQLEEHANFLISGNTEQSVRGDAISDWYAYLALVSVLKMASVNMVIVTDVFWRSFC